MTACRPALFAAVALALGLVGSSTSLASWSAKVDPPREARLAPQSTDFAIPFSGNFGGGGEALYPTTPGGFVAIGKNAFDKDVRQVWDLATKSQVAALKGQLGFDDKTLAQSPDGAYLAGKATFRRVVEVRSTRTGRIAQAFDQDRLDLVAAADGKPIVGWRPYEKEAGDARAVLWAGFVDTGQVVTINKAGMLILWSVPACQAVYTLDDAFQGSPATGPGRNLLFGFDGKTLRVLDALTGVLKGDGAAPTTNLGLRPELRAAADDDDGQRFAALFHGGTLVVWDLKTGKVASEFAHASTATQIEWAGPKHVLIDGRTLVDLDANWTVWDYVNAPVSASGPDGWHWYLTRGAPGKDEATLAAIDPLAGSLEKAEALAANPKAPAVIRPGSRVSIQVDLAGPPGDGNYRKAITDALAAQLKANGLVVVDDGPPAARPNGFQVSCRRAVAPDARLVVSAREKDTGRTIEYRRIGGFPRNIPVVRLFDLICEISLVDAKGPVTWMPPATLPMQPFGFVLRMPAGENVPEVYLKKLQCGRVKDWATGAGTPYFVARDGAGVVRLPGRTDLADLSAK